MIMIIITIITDNHRQVRSCSVFSKTLQTQLDAAATAERAQLRCQKRPEIKYFLGPLVWATEPSFSEASSEISSIKNSEGQITFRGL